jgi:hypothetical protein
VGAHSCPLAQPDVVQHSESAELLVLRVVQAVAIEVCSDNNGRTGLYPQLSSAAQSALRPHGMAHSLRSVHAPERQAVGSNWEHGAPPTSRPCGSPHSHRRGSFKLPGLNMHTLPLLQSLSVTQREAQWPRSQAPDWQSESRAQERPA